MLILIVSCIFIFAPTKTFAVTLIFASSLTPTFALGLEKIYTNENLQKATNLALELFV